MNWKNTTDRYGSVTIGLHWLMLLLMAGVYAVINLHDVAEKGSALRADLKTWHFALGLAVLALVAVRLANRWFSGPAPGIVPPLPAWQQRVAGAIHVALYVFMIGMPLLGWIAVSARGTPVEFLGVRLPMLMAQDKASYDTLKDFHETIGTVGYYLVGLHAVAALLHHYVTRDDTVLRMLPLRGR